ncbi:MAG: hypothetical protein NC517_08145 [Firmicutes bacterium]|nr:hypothetical protein [Bacillota bacterium]
MGEIMKADHSKRRIITLSNFVFLLLLSAYMGVTLFLFHRQTVNYGGGYTSDVQAYILEMQGLESGYDFPYPILFWTGRLFLPFTSPQHAMAIAITLLNGLTPVALKYYFDKYLTASGRTGEGAKLLSSVLAFTLVLVSMLYPLTYLGRYHEIGQGFLYRYLGVFTPNPYHNATYLAARPFSVVAFFSFAEILKFYEKEDKWYHPQYLVFSVSLLLATLTKPSFSLVLVCVAGCIMLWRLVSHRLEGWKAFFQMGIWFIPTLLALLYQFGDVFQPGKISGEGIGIGFLTAWRTATDNIFLSVFLGMAFPLSVLLFSLLHREIPKILCFSWQFFLGAAGTLAVLYEKGYRLPHMNFAWGYMYGLFFSYAVSLLVLAGNTFKKKQPLWQLGIQWGMYGLHLICGLDYYRVLLQGGLFH